MSLGDDIRIGRFDLGMQEAFRLLVLDGMAERWGSVDESLNTDLDDIDAHYANDCVLVALNGALVVGTGILLLRVAEGEIVRMSTHREYDDVALRRNFWRSWFTMRPSMESFASWWRRTQSGRRLDASTNHTASSSLTQHRALLGVRTSMNF